MRYLRDSSKKNQNNNSGGNSGNNSVDPVDENDGRSAAIVLDLHNQISALHRELARYKSTNQMCGQELNQQVVNTQTTQSQSLDSSLARPILTTQLQSSAPASPIVTTQSSQQMINSMLPQLNRQTVSDQTDTLGQQRLNVRQTVTYSRLNQQVNAQTTQSQIHGSALVSPSGTIRSDREQINNLTTPTSSQLASESDQIDRQEQNLDTLRSYATLLPVTNLNLLEQSTLLQPSSQIVHSQTSSSTSIESNLMTQSDQQDLMNPVSVPVLQMIYPAASSQLNRQEQPLQVLPIEQIENLSNQTLSMSPTIQKRGRGRPKKTADDVESSAKKPAKKQHKK